MTSALDTGADQELSARLTVRGADGGGPLRRLLPPAALILGVILLWELLVTAADVSERILPAPSRIVWAAANDLPNLLNASLISGAEGAAGLVLGVATAIVLSAAIHLWPLVRRSLTPILLLSQTIPIIALAPLIIIWFGFEILPKILLVALYAVFPVVVSLVRGLDSAPSEMVNVSRTFGARQWWVLRHVKTPAALPQFFGGVRVAATYVVAGAIVAEFVGGRYGLGIYLVAAKASFRTDLVFAAALATGILTLLIFGAVVLIERAVIRWTPEPRR